MASYNQENDIVGGGYGFGGGGGVFAMVILMVVVLFVLFRGNRDDHRDGYGYGYGGGCGCGPCVQPTFKDESNYEEESHLKDKLCCIDRDIWNTDQDVWKTACETQKEVHCEGEKTRALIEQNYIQDLRDQLAEKSMQNLTLKQEMFTEKKFDQMAALIGGVNHKIERLECETPKRPPVFAECVTPNTHDIDCDDRRFRDDFRRRGRCNDFDGCCFG